MPKKEKKNVKKQPPKKRNPTQTQSQNINVYYGTKPTKRRGKRKTQIKKPVLYQSVNYQLSQPQQLPSFIYPSSQTPSLLPPPIARSSAVAESLIVPAPIIQPEPLSALPPSMRTQSLPRRIGSAIVSTGLSGLSSGLSSLFQPLPPFPAREEVPAFAQREEVPAFTDAQPAFAPPPFPLVPYQAALPPPEDEFFDIPEDPFNLEQPPEDVFNIPERPVLEAPAEAVILGETPTQEQPAQINTQPIDNPFGIDYNPAQFEELKQQTALYREAEQPKSQPKKASLTPLQKEEAKAKRKAKKQQTQQLAQLEQKYLLPESEYNPFGLNTVAVIENKPVFIKSQPKKAESRPNLTFFDLPEEQPAFGLEVAQPKKAEKEKGGLERVRPEEEQPLQYGFSN